MKHPPSLNSKAFALLLKRKKEGTERSFRHTWRKRSGVSLFRGPHQSVRL